MLLLLLLTTHYSTITLEANTATHAPPSQFFQSLRVYTLPSSYNLSIIFPYDILQPHSGITRFLLDPRQLSDKDNIWQSFILHPRNVSHHISLIIALESRIEPHFSYSLLFEIRSVSRVPKSICRPFFWKTSAFFRSPLSIFQSTHASKPFLTSTIIVAFNILISICKLIFLPFRFFIAPTVFTNNTT